MSTTFIDDLKTQLHDIELQLKTRRHAIDEGPLERRAEALKELAELEVRRKELTDRLVEAEAKGADHWSQVQKGFVEDIKGLADTVESWIIRH